MSSSTTGRVIEDHRHLISIMAIGREKKSVSSPIVAKPCGLRSTNGSSYRRSDERRNTVSCRELHLCGGPEGDMGIGLGLENFENYEPGSKTKATQTDYRESSAQTIPWEAPYKLIRRTNENPEILSLVKSTWGNGLPAGIHEAQIIQRMRTKRAWLDALPPMDCPENKKIRESITAAIEANEWAFREAEIQFIMDTRMQLMERIAKNKTKEKDENISKRLDKYAKRLSQSRDKQIRNIRLKFSREVRKLNRKHRVASATIKNLKPIFIARYASAKSDLHTKNGENGDEKKIDESGNVSGPIGMDDCTKWLPDDRPLIGPRRDNFGPEGLCPRQTRWNDEKLRKLHADLKAIRLKTDDDDSFDLSNYLKRKPKIPNLPVTPVTKGSDNIDGYWENSSLFIQKITRGRAVQCMMFEGRNRCRELIEELQKTRALEESKASLVGDGEMEKLIRDLQEDDGDLRENRMSEILDSLEGMTVAGMLDMLSKENTRLREERRAHGFVLLAERERNRREAAESGRRQLERNRRRELDEMFRQIVKVNQDSVETYLEDVIKEGIDWISDEQAKRYVVELADEIDATTSRNDVDENPSKDEELIADMIHNFLLPDVEKKMMRKKIRSRQLARIDEARRAIYEETTKSMEKVKITIDKDETQVESSRTEENSSLSEIQSDD